MTVKLKVNLPRMQRNTSGDVDDSVDDVGLLQCYCFLENGKALFLSTLAFPLLEKSITIEVTGACPWSESEGASVRLTVLLNVNHQIAERPTGNTGILQ